MHRVLYWLVIVLAGALTAVAPVVLGVAVAVEGHALILASRCGRSKPTPRVATLSKSVLGLLLVPRGGAAR